ncbi:MAG: MgtC/SapB family protein [Oscillospiraceae bacterium]|jgi:uncharacterized membrane protein YhiD involved in acid resistance|nr:MgtC/SapB family protein [Oscillospiraceae bacterium]
MAVTTFVRLGVAALLGGVIGMEREHSHRPAGLRTHILVAVGAALVMCTSEYIFTYYQEVFELKSVPDPARLGAQVISGIGFLGAGTILREGFSVKGLTTAASLWSVSCVGLAVGIGFWPGAVIATLVIFFVLNVVKRLPLRNPGTRIVYVGVEDIDDASADIIGAIQRGGAKYQNISIMPPADRATAAFLSKETHSVLIITVFMKPSASTAFLKETLLRVDGVKDVYIED